MPLPAENQLYPILVVSVSTRDRIRKNVRTVGPDPNYFRKDRGGMREREYLLNRFYGRKNIGIRLEFVRTTNIVNLI